MNLRSSCCLGVRREKIGVRMGKVEMIRVRIMRPTLSLSSSSGGLGSLGRIGSRGVRPATIIHLVNRNPPKFTAGAGTRHQRKHSSGISSHLHDALDAATLLRERCGRILTVGCDSPRVFSPHSASPFTLVHTDLFPSPSTRYQPLWLRVLASPDNFLQ